MYRWERAVYRQERKGAQRSAQERPSCVIMQTVKKGTGPGRAGRPFFIPPQGGESMACKESDPFYHSKAWKRVRRLALERDQGMCQDCMDRFRAGYGIKPHRADMVHHIIPREERPDLALNLANLRSLCNECHNKRHPEKGRQADKSIQPAAEKKHSMRVVKV